VLGSDLALELHRREAIVRGTPVALTPTESRLLYALAANLGRTVSTETLLARGWAETEDADPSYVWVTMRRLRQKIEADPNHPSHLLTMRGVGYRLVGADGTSAPTDDTNDDGAEKRATGSSGMAGS
jgi:DNA-binding response OmpR family regulator